MKKTSVSFSQVLRTLTAASMGMLLCVSTLPVQAQSAAARQLQVGSNSTAQAADNAKNPAPTATVAAEQAGQVHSSKPADEGIRVHGHWVIDVRNPDGSLAEHRDFDNALQGGGAAYLIALMAGYTVPSDYEIFLQSNGTSPCIPPSGGLDGCTIVRSLTTSPASNSCPHYYCTATLSYAYNLNYSVLTSNSMVLTGSFTAGRAGTIDSVSTYAGDCPIQFIGGGITNISPATCNAAAGGVGVNSLTGTTISSVAVASGQIVQVTVTISFS